MKNASVILRGVCRRLVRKGSRLPSMCSKSQRKNQTPRCDDPQVPLGKQNRFWFLHLKKKSTRFPKDPNQMLLVSSVEACTKMAGPDPGIWSVGFHLWFSVFVPVCQHSNKFHALAGKRRHRSSPLIVITQTDHWKVWEQHYKLFVIAHSVNGVKTIWQEEILIPNCLCIDQMAQIVLSKTSSDCKAGILAKTALPMAPCTQDTENQQENAKTNCWCLRGAHMQSAFLCVTLSKSVASLKRKPIPMHLENILKYILSQKSPLAALSICRISRTDLQCWVRMTDACQKYSSAHVRGDYKR